MKNKSKLVIRIFSFTLLAVYLFGSQSLFSFYNHSHDNHHHNHHNHHDTVKILFCESFFQNFTFEKKCSHESHLASFEEKCEICDHFFNIKPALLDKPSKSFLKSLISVKYQLFVSLDLIDSTCFLNKSPPFLV